MNTLRTLSVLLGAVAVLVLVSGTLGFDSATADRDVAVNVTSDEQAYVGYEQAPDGVFGTDLILVKSGHEEPLVEIQNRFDSPINVTDVSADTTHVSVEQPEKPTNLQPGDSGTISADVRCSGWVALEHVGITVTVDGFGTQATLDGNTVHREAVVLCANLPVHWGLHWTDHRASDTGTQSAETSAIAGANPATAPGEHVDATVWIADMTNGTIGSASGTWDTGADPAGFDPHLGDGIEVVGIELDGHGVAFVNPDWEQRALRDGRLDPTRYLDDPALSPFDHD